MTLPVHLDDPARPALHQARLNHISKLALTRRRVVVISGAGISVSAGIPDFRSPAGLYAMVKQAHPDAVVAGKDLFDAGLFRDEETRSLFFKFAVVMHQGAASVAPTRTHRFFAEMKQRGRLLRWYTQNIDDLELRAMREATEKNAVEQVELDSGAIKGQDMAAGAVGCAAGCAATTGAPPSPPPSQYDTLMPLHAPYTPLDLGAIALPTQFLPSPPASQDSLPSSSAPLIPPTPTKPKSSPISNALLHPIVQLHGTLSRVHCTHCSYSSTLDTDRHVAYFQKGVAPPCPTCSERSQARIDTQRRPIAQGALRPSIVLYNELHPHGHRISQQLAADSRRRPDLVIIMGTSLRVHGCKGLVKELARRCSGEVVFVNREPVSWTEWSGLVHWWVRGSCDDWIEELRDAEMRGVHRKRTPFIDPGAAVTDALGPAAMGATKPSRQQAVLTPSGRIERPSLNVVASPTRNIGASKVSGAKLKQSVGGENLVDKSIVTLKSTNPSDRPIAPLRNPSMSDLKANVNSSGDSAVAGAKRKRAIGTKKAA